MEYYANIQDIDNLEDELILEISRKDDISLKWLGGDDKTQPIVGSEFNFSLKAEDCEQLKYEKYFTSDERKWRTSVFRSDNDELIWIGFLLPESYSEPYKQGVKFVVFSAVDGLGLLKGKELTEDFYRDEKTVTDILVKCLSLTGLDLWTYISPAILNSTGVEWNEIYLDTALYYDEDKLPTAYDFLEEILISTRCQLFQADGRFYIEGINKRQLVSVDYERYGQYINGHATYLGRITIERNVKELTWEAYPNINLVAPLRSVTAVHESETFELPDDVVQLSDVPFDAHDNTQINYYYSKYWSPNGGYFPIVGVKDDLLVLANETQFDGFNENRKINLRNKPWVQKGWRIKFKLSVSLVIPSDLTSPSDSLIERWVDYAPYRITVAGNEMYFNLNTDVLSDERLVFDDSGKAEVELNFTVRETGYLDIEFFEPYASVSSTQASAYKINELTVESDQKSEDFVFTTDLIEDASQTQEIDLAISEDLNGYSKSFYLEKKRAYTNEITWVEGKVYNMFEQNGQVYAVIDIKTAYLIDQFYPNSITVQNDSQSYNQQQPNVIYNFEGSEMHVVEVNTLLEDATVRVPYRKYKDVTDRNSWVEWTDDIYKIEKKSYLQVVAEIEQKIFSIPYIKIDGSALNPIKFNDIIRFNYKGVNRYFYPSNCEWTPANRRSNLILHESIYNGARYGSLPPFVDAGEDKFLEGSGVISTIMPMTDAIAFDPDGTIDTILWTQIEGDTTATITTPDVLNPVISNLTGDHYVFQIEVTDNTGNVATDTVEINRVQSLDLEIDTLETDTGIDEGRTFYYAKFQVLFDPEINENYSMNLNINVFIEYSNRFRTLNYLIIEKNGQQYRWELRQFLNEGIPGSNSQNNDKTLSENFTLNFRKGDNIFVYAYVSFIAGLAYPQNATSRFIINNFEQENGYPSISNLPQSQQVFLQET